MITRWSIARLKPMAGNKFVSKSMASTLHRASFAQIAFLLLVMHSIVGDQGLRDRVSSSVTG